MGEAGPVLVYDLAARIPVHFQKGLDLETPLYKQDVSDAALRAHHQEVHLLVALQALANRQRPSIYLRYVPRIDDFWMLRMAEDGWISMPRCRTLNRPEDLLRPFAHLVKGLVVWDPAVPATANLASTIAGAEDLLPVPYDASDEGWMKGLQREFGFAPKVWLAGEDGAPRFTGAQTGSAKNDAYRWLIGEYVRPGRVNTRLLGYYIDAHWQKGARASWLPNHQLTNQDFIIANRGVVFDLHVYGDEAPLDDPDQRPGTDQETLEMLLRACYEHNGPDQMIHVAGYVPWRFKYTNCENEDGSTAGGQHGAVAAEWKCTEILSAYNAWLDADALDIAAMTNASFFQHYPLDEEYPQAPRPTLEQLRAEGLLDEENRVVPANYVTHYVGDYDAAAWLWWNMPHLWTDPGRGSVPLSWAINPVLAIRFPFCLHWMRTTATEMDVFTAGDSGAGYVNPRNLCEPRPYAGLPSALPAWEVHCRGWFDRFDLDVIGFIIDGHCESMTDEGFDTYGRIAPGGFVLHRHPEPGGLHNGVPWICYSGDLPMWDGVEEDWVREIEGALRPGGPHFHIFRAVIQRPSLYARVDRMLRESAGHPYRMVDLRTLMMLVRLHARA